MMRMMRDSRPYAGMKPFVSPVVQVAVLIGSASGSVDLGVVGETGLTERCTGHQALPGRVQDRRGPDGAARRGPSRRIAEDEGISGTPRVLEPAALQHALPLRPRHTSGASDTP